MWKAKEPTFIIQQMERSRRHSLQNMKFRLYWTRKEPSKRLLMMRSPANPVPVASRRFDLPAVDYKVTSPADERTNLMFDGNGYSTYYLPEGKKRNSSRVGRPSYDKRFLFTPLIRDAIRRDIFQTINCQWMERSWLRASSQTSNITRLNKKYILLLSRAKN